jgi:hypothetical protein
MKTLQLTKWQYHSVIEALEHAWTENVYTDFADRLTRAIQMAVITH